MEQRNVIIYNTLDGRTSVSLLTKDGTVWMNQNQLAELFDTSKQNISQHIASVLQDNELDASSVVKNYFTTAVGAGLKTASPLICPGKTFFQKHSQIP